MSDPLNTLTDLLWKQGPLKKEDLIAGPFGGLYRRDLIGFGTPWRVYHTAMGLIGYDQREATLRSALEAFNVALHDRLWALKKELQIFKTQQKLSLQGKEFDREKLRHASEEMGQVSLCMIVLKRCGMDEGGLYQRFGELCDILLHEAHGVYYNHCVIRQHLSDLIECWTENDAYSWVRKLQIEVGELPVTSLRHLHQHGEDDSRKKLPRFVELVNKAYDEGRLSLRVMHRTLIMVVDAMEWVKPQERGYALGLIEHQLEKMGCKIFQFQEEGRKERILGYGDTFCCSGREYSRANEFRETASGELLVRLEGGDRWIVFSTRNSARLCIYQAALCQHWREQGDLTLLLPDVLDPTGSCAIVNCDLDPIFKKKIDADSLVNELRKVAQRGTMPAGDISDLICARSDGTIAWRVVSDEEQKVSPEEIENFLIQINEKEVHSWMIATGLGAMPEAKKKRQALYAELEKGHGKLLFGLEERSTRLIGIFGYRGAKEKDVIQALKSAVVPEWLSKNGIISHFSQSFLNDIEVAAMGRLEEQFPMKDDLKNNSIIADESKKSLPSLGSSGSIKRSGKFNSFT
jgi:hypothetical protein